MSTSGDFQGVLRELEYGYKNTRFLRQHMELFGLTPDQIKTLDDFQRIPLTRKQHLRKNYPIGVLANGFSLNHPFVMHFQSSGTSGERLVSAILIHDLARRQATSLSVNKDFESLWRPGGRPKSCRYAAPNCSSVECGVGTTAIDERILKDGTLVLSVAHDLLTTPEYLIHQALDEIEAYDPELLVVDPTHLAFLIRNAVRLKRRIKTSRKLHIVCGYTQLTRIARRQIKEFFGNEVPVGNMLGMSELGYLGFECHQGHLHANNQDFFLEIVGEGGAAPQAEPGELVISTIDDQLIPKIRYATGDIYRLHGPPCPCGSSLPRVTLEGRASHLLRCSDGRQVSPHQVDTAVGESRGIDLYQLEQIRHDFLFRYVTNSRFSLQERDGLEARLRVLLQHAVLRLEEVRYIACERSGKFQSCRYERGA